MTQITARLTSRGDTEANWTSANPVLSAKEIAFSTDAFYTGTDQQKFKVGDGTQTWVQLDYMPIGTSTQTLAQTLTNGKKTGQQTIESDNGKSILSILNTLLTMVFQDGAIYASAKVADVNSALEFFNGSDGGGFYVYASKNEITHNILNEITAPENNITGHVTVTGNTSAFSDSGLVRIIVRDADGEIRTSFLGGHNKVLINDVAAYLTSNNGANSASIYADAVNGNHMVNTVKNVLDAPLNEVSQDPTTALGIVTKQYVDGIVAGLLDDRGSYDASVNLFPSSGGSGTAGAILKGDIWYISVGGTLGGSAVTIGDSVRALADAPGQTATNWSILETNIGYVPENISNKTGTVAGNESSTTLYLHVKGFYDYLVSLVWLTAQMWGTWINALTSKTTPVDADQVVLMDSADSNNSKKLSWTNIKATLKSYFDTLYATIADVKNFNYGSVTPYTSATTTTDEVAFVIPISAGKLVTGDYFEWWNLFETNSTANSKTFRLWISTANETIGNAVSGSATQIGIFSVTTSSQSAIMTRRFAVLSDTTILSKSSSAANFRDDLTSETGVPINVTIPTLANQTYFVVTVNRANSGDTLIAKITELQLRKK